MTQGARGELKFPKRSKKLGGSSGLKLKCFGLQREAVGRVVASCWFPTGCQGPAKSDGRRRRGRRFLISIKVSGLVLMVSAQSLNISGEPVGSTSGSSCLAPDVAEGQLLSFFSHHAPGQTFNTALKTSGCSAKSLSSKRSCDPDTSPDQIQISPCFFFLSLSEANLQTIKKNPSAI